MGARHRALLGRRPPVNPYYVMWRPPDQSETEFVLMLPFSPKNRQVMIGWIAGMCDGDNYGRFVAYKFPKNGTSWGHSRSRPRSTRTPTSPDS